MASQTGIVVSTVTEISGAYTAYTITNLGSIATSWSAPASCSQTTTYDNALSLLYSFDLLAGDDWNCLPPRVEISTVSNSVPASTTPSFPGITAANVLYYSPATCPSGWRTAATSILPSSTVPIVACCPFGWVWNGIGPQGMGPACDLPEFRTAPGENQSYTITNLVDATGRGNPTTSAYSLVLTYSVDVWAYPLYIVEGQISNVTTSGTSTTLSTFTNPLVATSTSPSSSRGTSSTSNLPPKGLTPGPKAGIAVAISISFVLLVLGIFFHFRRRGQQRSRSQEVAILEINSVADTLFADSNRNGDRTEQQSNHQNDRAIIQSAPYETKPPEYRSSFSRGRASPRSPQSDIYHATDEPAIQGPPFGSKISAVAASANQSPHTYCPHQPHASDYRLGGRADYTSSSCPHCNE